MPLADQLASKLLEIVDFPVEDDPDGAVLIRHWLVSGAEVDDAQPPHPDAAAAFDADAFIVRTAVADLGAHRAHQGRVGDPVTQQKAGNSTHNRKLSLTVSGVRSTLRPDTPTRFDIDSKSIHTNAILQD